MNFYFCFCLLNYVYILLQPNDIIAAESEGAMAIGVCTGVFGKEELEQVGNGGAVTIAWMKLFVN